MTLTFRITNEAKRDATEYFDVPAHRADSWINVAFQNAYPIDDRTFARNNAVFIVEPSVNGSRMKIVSVRRDDDIDGCIYFNGVWVKNHAIHRAFQRFGVRKADAPEWLVTQYRKAKFVGNCVDSYGKHGRIFAAEGITLAVHPGRDIIRTVYLGSISSIQLYEKFSGLARKEQRKLQRRLDVRQRELSRYTAALNVEKAELAFIKETTRSVAKKMACQARINAINQFLAELQTEIDRLVDELSLITKSIVPYEKMKAVT
jgi:hypothetical protein